MKVLLTSLPDNIAEYDGRLAKIAFAFSPLGLLCLTFQLFILCDKR